MENSVTRIEKWVMGLCLGVLVFFTLSIAVRFVTRQLLIKHFNMDNAFTEFVWFDNIAVGGSGNEEETQEDASASEMVEIDWAKRYPFADSEGEAQTGETAVSAEEESSVQSIPSDRITNIVTGLEDGIESYTTDLLVWHEKIVESANAYEKCIGWNFTSFGEYNGVIALSDGYLSGYTEKRDTTKQCESLSDLNDFCQSKGINFLYVQAPYKISEYDDADVSGTLDFSNQNANEFLAGLDAAGIDYYDIRETIHENEMNQHELFYKTDHHWLTTTGLWAAQNILAFCNKAYGWNADLSLLDAEQFDYTTYEQWLLGSQGRKVTLARCEPDDFTLLYPKYETSFHYSVPARGIDTVADYSIVYDMSVINKCDYYNSNPYSGCNYGEQPLIQIENQMTAENHKILMIRDSFSDCVISCLALAEKNVDSMDIRYFTGSVKTYIEESSPDLVIVMYNAGGVGGELDYSGHDDIFDFR